MTPLTPTPTASQPSAPSTTSSPTATSTSVPSNDPFAWSDVAPLAITSVLTVVATLISYGLLEVVRNRFATKREDTKEERAILKEQRDEKREAISRKEIAAREREISAAEELDHLFSRLARDVVERSRSNYENDDVSSRILDNFDQVSGQAAYLPPSLRRDVEDLSLLLRDADELTGTHRQIGSYHYHHLYKMAENISSAAHEILAAFLRHDPQPGLPRIIVEYQLALDELNAERAIEFAPEIADFDYERRRWLRSYPRIASRLGEEVPDDEDAPPGYIS